MTGPIRDYETRRSVAFEPRELTTVSIPKEEDEGELRLFALDEQIQLVGDAARGVNGVAVSVVQVGRGEVMHDYSVEGADFPFVGVEE